jgi:hypothetical protein
MPRGVRQSLEERFWLYVAKGPGCWGWTASCSDGYGQIKSGKVPLRAHRVSWVIHFGPIPEGLDVLHHCDNPPCTRPDHLFLGTDLTNVRDAIRKGRMNPKPPSRAKLTEDQRDEIRARYAAGGITHRQLADEYGIHFTNIGRAIRAI